MKLIEKISEHISEEIHDATCYARWAVEEKENNSSLADVLYSLSQDEIKHATMLHGEVVRIIEQYRRDHGDPPSNMMAVYDYLHKKEIEKMAEAKNYQAIYKG